MNAWLPKCPPTHIQIGWDYRFVSAVPPYLFLSIISACTVVRPGSETLSYWQGGVYVRNGKIDVSVCQWKDKLVLQVKIYVFFFILCDSIFKGCWVVRLRKFLAL